MFNKAFSLIIIAGLMNGAFALPMKKVKRISSESVWFFHSLFGLMILPWVIMITLFPGKLIHYYQLNFGSIVLLIMGGVIFGLGQICFAWAIKKLGIASSFLVNLGLGIALGSLSVAFYQKILFSWLGLKITVSVLFIFIGVLLHYFSKNKEEKAKKIDSVSSWLFAIFAGLASAFQNFVFVVLISNSSISLSNDPFLVWPPFLFIASLTMAPYFFKKIKNRGEILFLSKEILFSSPYILVSGIFFTGSIAFYSWGMKIFNDAYKSLGWPIFMATIILSSQIFGGGLKKLIEKKTNRMKEMMGILLILFSFFILASTH